MAVTNQAETKTKKQSSKKSVKKQDAQFNEIVEQHKEPSQPSVEAAATAAAADIPVLNHGSNNTSTVNELVDIGGKPWKTLSKQCNIDSVIMETIEQDFMFRTMAPVQENSIPLLLSHKDVIVEACTGSGKTLAYLVPALHMVKKRVDQLVKAAMDDGEDDADNVDPQADCSSKVPQKRVDRLVKNQVFGIVICPTRELALQVHKVASSFEHRTHIRSRLVIGLTANTGGVSRGKSSSSSDSPSTSSRDGPLVVATPGRLLDMIKGRVIDVRELDILILDEADRILEMGFQHQINQVLALLPRQRRTALYSATQTTDMTDLIRSGLRNPVKVTVEVKLKERKLATPKELSNFYMLADRREEKLSQLLSLLEHYHDKKIIVYFLTCSSVDFFGKIIFKLLKQRSIKHQNRQLLTLHGKMVQKKRVSVFEDFTNSTSGVLFCTDVAARGLDFPGVQYIIQYDPPTNPSMYVHRVGRTARMGRTGTSIVLLCKHEDNYVEYIELKKIPIQQMPSLTGNSSSNPADETNDPNDLKESTTAATTTTNNGNLFAEMKELICNDRDLLDKCDDAIVSFIRAYKEHQLNYIFKLSELDMADLARTFCLIKMPKMWNKSFRRLRLRIPAENEDVDVENIPYADQKREKARLLRVEKERGKQKAEAAAAAAAAEAEAAADSNDEGQDAPARSGRNRVAPQEKRETLYELKQQVREMRQIKSHKRKRLYEDIEHNELRREDKLLRKLERGLITEQEYEALTGETDIMREFQKFVPSTAAAAQRKNEEDSNGADISDDDDDDSDKKGKRAKGKRSNSENARKRKRLRKK